MIDILVVSDSTGETASSFSNSILVQFPSLEYKRSIFSNVKEKEDIGSIFENASKNSIIFMTIIDKELSNLIKKRAEEKSIHVIDLLGDAIDYIEEISGQKALRQSGLGRGMSLEYLDKMEAIEFALKYDDGKNPKGFLLSDIVLVGVSRTSKTPLSIYLANKKYKVSNLPLIPEIDLPSEIFDVDKNKIVGLIIDEDLLKEIRNSRLKALGLESTSIYADDNRIRVELRYANDVFKKLGCRVINVSGLTIEAIASRIIKAIEE